MFSTVNFTFYFFNVIVQITHVQHHCFDSMSVWQYNSCNYFCYLKTKHSLPKIKKKDCEQKVPQEYLSTCFWFIIPINCLPRLDLSLLSKTGGGEHGIDLFLIYVMYDVPIYDYYMTEGYFLMRNDTLKLILPVIGVYEVNFAPFFFFPFIQYKRSATNPLKITGLLF